MASGPSHHGMQAYVASGLPSIFEKKIDGESGTVERRTKLLCACLRFDLVLMLVWPFHEIPYTSVHADQHSAAII
jgi:hypothetical protein